MPTCFGLFILDFLFALVFSDALTDEEIDSDSELDEYMAQQCGILPPNGMNDDMIKLEDDECDSDEMGSDEDESEDEEEEEKAPLKVEPPSKKRPNGEAMKNTVASKKAKVAIQKGGKKKCAFPCGSSCKN